jgi:flagellar biosynthesis/type III secretory pathway chaperone
VSLNQNENSIDRYLEPLYACLQKMVGLHRQLYETCKLEREAFVSADVKLITEQTHAKELIIETIRQSESERIRISTFIAADWKVKLSDLTLSFIIREVEPRDSGTSEKFRSTLTALTVLIERAKKLNESNRELVEKSLEHVNAMKKNVLGEALPATETYGNLGQKLPNTGGARLLSTEA